MSIKIDKEFESLIPPLSAEEFKQLEENCVKDGIRDPLILWALPNGDNILVDGHNRWKIAAQHGGMSFTTKCMEFDDRDDAKAWIIKNQFGRRNLNEWQRFDLNKELEAIEKAKAKRRMLAGKKTDPTPTLAEGEKGETRDKIAKRIGVSHGTYDKMKRIDEMATPYVKSAVRKGDISINKAFNTTFPKRPDPVKVAKEEHEQFIQNKDAIVDFKAAKVDQINQRIISNAMTQEVLKLLSTIEKFGYMHKEEELKVLKDELPEDSARILVGTIKNCYRILEKIQNAIERRK